MIYLDLELIIMLLLIVLFIATLSILFVQNKKIEMNRVTPMNVDNNNLINDQRKTASYQVNLNLNRRKHFRVTLTEDCVSEFLYFENKKLEQLKHKKFTGKIQDISVSGLKFTCPYNLPVKQKIVFNITFSIKNIPFTLKAQFIRKEEYLQKDTFIYGVQFIDISKDEQKHLNLLLNKIELQRRQKMVL